MMSAVRYINSVKTKVDNLSFATLNVLTTNMLPLMLKFNWQYYP